MLVRIKDILIISDPQDLLKFEYLFGAGKKNSGIYLFCRITRTKEHSPCLYNCLRIYK